MEGKRASSERMTTAHKGPWIANARERDHGTPQHVAKSWFVVTVSLIRGCPPSDRLWYSLRTA